MAPSEVPCGMYLSICFFIALSWPFVGAEQRKMKLLLLRYIRRRQGFAARHQTTAFQEAHSTVRRSVVQQAMGQGAPWRLVLLWYNAALAVGLWRGGLCTVSPTW